MIRKFSVVISLRATFPVPYRRFYLDNYNFRLRLLIIVGGIAGHTGTHWYKLVQIGLLDVKLDPPCIIYNHVIPGSQG